MTKRSAHHYEHEGPRFIHVAIGVLLVLWNGLGLAASIAAQTGSVPAMDPETAAFFDAQPLWFVLLVDIGPAAGLAGALALLLQHRAAVWLFCVQLAVIALGNLYELAAGTSLMLGDPQVVVSTVPLFILFAAQIIYARWLHRRGLLY